MCENCLITYETKLRILGIYDDYEQYKMLSNELGFLKDARSKIKECLKFFSESSGDVEMVCNSEGFIERWKDINKDQILLDSTRDLKLATKKIAAITKLKKEAKKKYIENAAKYKIETYV
jgi:ribosomal protein S8